MDIKDKIAKLLALADSPNEHEAKVALLKARELMAEHKLRPEEVQKMKEEKVIRDTIDVTCTKMTNIWAVRLSSVIADHYCCRAYRNHRHGEKKVTIGFVGLEEDFEICVRIFKYAFDYVENQCKQIRKKHKGLYAANYLRDILNVYGDGFCTGLQIAYEEQDKEKEKGWGLVLATPQAVLDAMRDMTKGRSFTRRVAYDSVKLSFAQKGFDDGKKFDPSTKLEEPVEKIKLA